LKVQISKPLTGVQQYPETIDRANMTQPYTTDSALLTEFFNALDERSIPYCVVGDVSGLPQIPENDVDIVCATDSVPALTGLIASFATRHGGRIAQMLRHESAATYYVLHFPIAEGRCAFLKLDICSDYVVGGRLFLDAAWLLEGRAPAAGKSFFTAAPAREFAYYIMKKIAKGFADTSALRHLSDLVSRDLDGCRAVLNRYWTKDSAQRIEAAIVAKQWSDLEPVLSALRRELAEHLPPQSLSLALAEIGRRMWRVLEPTGFVVAVLGPDGAGKGTLLATLLPRLSALGRQTFRFHLTPPIWSSPLSTAVVDDPHARPERGGFTSALKLFYLAFVYNIGWLNSVWLARRQSGMIFFDRYYHDHLADPRRYRSGAPKWLVRLVGRLIPMPDLFLVMDVLPEAARQRKAEVSAEESARQFGAYRALCAELPNAHLIDANRSPGEVASQCEGVVVRAMAARLQGRARHARV
jgi:thymidylate kinase